VRQAVSRRKIWIVLVGLAAVLVPFAGTSSADAATSCRSWAGGGITSLQAAVNASTCVTVQPGTWHIANHLVLPAGHTVTGVVGRAGSTILYADPSTAWGCCTGMVDVSATNSLSTANAAVKYLTLQAAGRAVIGVGGGVFTVDHVAVVNTLCNGLSVYGPRVRVYSANFKGNGYGRKCPNAPPGAAIYVHPVNGNPVTGPVVTYTSFTGNGTPIDVDSVDGGSVTHSSFSGNDGWAGVALYRASGWTVSANTINQPRAGSMGDAMGGNYSYQPGCQYGPTGGHPAAVWLCENFDSDGHRADRNTISGNTVSGYYGLLLMGLDDPEESGVPTLVPSSNTISDNTISAVTPAADDRRPGTLGPGDNVWTRNTCAGVACPVVYF
jgi:hypothetical protein